MYRNALCYELCTQGLDSVIEKQMKVHYRGTNVGTYYADILVDDRIIIEVKCVERVAYRHILQVRNYMKATGCQVGLIINFGTSSVEVKRLYQK